MVRKVISIRFPDMQVRYLDHFAKKFNQPVSDLIKEAVVLYTLKLRKEEMREHPKNDLA